MAGPRVYYAMAKDGLFFRKVGEINKKGVPGFALAVQGVWSVLLCLSGTYGDLLDYVIFAVLIFFTLTILAIFILRKKRLIFQDLIRHLVIRLFRQFIS